MRFIAMLLLVVLAVWSYSAFKYAWENNRTSRGQFAAAVMLGYVLSAAMVTAIVGAKLHEIAQYLQLKLRK